MCHHFLTARFLIAGPRMPSSAFAGTTGASATSAGAFASSSSHGASIPHPHGTLLFINTVKYLYETDGPCPAGFAAGIFGTGASSSHAGRSGPTSQFYDDDLDG